MSRRWLIGVSAAAHCAVGAAVFLSGAWHIEQMETKYHDSVSLSQPPPPAPAGGAKTTPKVEFTPKERKVIPKVRVQLEPKPADDPRPSTDQDLPPGNGSGDPKSTSKCVENCGDAPPADPVCGNHALEVGEQCDDGNNLNGDGCSSTCRTEAPPPRPVPTVLVPNGDLQARRISGDLAPRPSASTQQQMMRNDTHRLSATVKVCVGTEGGAPSAAMGASTGYSEYDHAILEAVGTWRYQPYLVNNKPVPVCSVVTFVYTMR